MNTSERCDAVLSGGDVVGAGIRRGYPGSVLSTSIFSRTLIKRGVSNAPLKPQENKAQETPFQPENDESDPGAEFPRLESDNPARKTIPETERPGPGPNGHAKNEIKDTQDQKPDD